MKLRQRPPLQLRRNRGREPGFRRKGFGVGEIRVRRKMRGSAGGAVLGIFGGICPTPLPLFVPLRVGLPMHVILAAPCVKYIIPDYFEEGGRKFSSARPRSAAGG